jgi:hypothetical protein
MTKPWAEMNREELLVEKGRWETNLQRANLELKTAKRTAAATKVFLPLQEMHALEEKRLRFAAGVRGLQCELSKRGPLVRSKSFNDYFFDEADAFLADDVFNAVYDRAEAQMKLERSKA